MALDVANSVILRFDAEKTVDRFAISEQIESFCEAATRLSAEREAFPTLSPPPKENSQQLIKFREAIDRYFRQSIETAIDDDDSLADLLMASSYALKAAGGRQSLEAATARSVLKLISGPDRSRMMICAHCGWLFIDRSKNRSRIWCDMAVCGNRQKAARHYRRKKDVES